MADGPPVLQIVVAGAGALGFYHLWWVPYQARLEVERLALAAASANLKKGMGAEEAVQKALAGACTAGAMVYKVPPSVAGPLCSVAGVLAEKLGKAVGKEAIAGAKKVGAGTKVAAKAVGHSAKVAVKSVRKVASWIGLGALPYELAAFDAPASNPFARHAAAGPARRKRRGLGGVSGGGRRLVPNPARRPVSGAAFYLRHL